MLRKKYLYNRHGVISNLFPNGCAEIAFQLDGVSDYTFLKRGRYYHEGRLVPENVALSKYLRIGTKVKFSCHVLDRLDDGNQDLSHYYRSYGWYVATCWTNLENKPDVEISLISGLFSVHCTVANVKKRHAIMTAFHNTDEQRIELLASKFYINGKRFPTSKSLHGALNIGDEMFCDAVPCIEEESRFDCKWFATCAFQGKRPRLPKPSDVFNTFCTNFVSSNMQNMLERGWIIDNDGETHANDSNQPTEKNKINSQLKSQLPHLINLHTKNPCAIFTCGYGFILDVLNDEYAILLGCFKRNVFQTILFHRGNAFLFKSSLARSKLSEIFIEGDRLRFIAVGAPENFLTHWIAVQVSVADDDYIPIDETRDWRKA